MKQFTTPEQTAKLIELGMPKPKSATGISWDTPEGDSPFINANSIEFEYHYSIGELLEIIEVFGYELSYQPEIYPLPKRITLTVGDSRRGVPLPNFPRDKEGRAEADRLLEAATSAEEVIDQLFYRIVILAKIT